MLPHQPGVPHLHVNRLLDCQNDDSERDQAFLYIFCRRCTTTKWKCIISRSVEDGNTRQQLSWNSGIQLRKKSPKFYKIKRVGIRAMKFEAARFTFRVKFSLPLRSSSLKLPNYILLVRQFTAAQHYITLYSSAWTCRASYLNEN